MPTVRIADRGNTVRRLQRLLRDDWDYRVTVDGVFGNETRRAVKQFQSTNHDMTGAPLVVDGIVGALTWWALTHRKAPRPELEPRPMRGGSVLGRRALRVALAELDAGAGEIGGNNRGRWVRKYLAPAGLGEGNPWCAAFVSWCVLAACDDDPARMPFRYQCMARNLFTACRARGFEVASPAPGDLVVWWRESLHSAKGHVGFVESVADGFLFTVEGNKTPRVARFRYVVGRIDRLIGFIRLPDPSRS
jgi:hypothetical protein